MLRAPSVIRPDETLLISKAFHSEQLSGLVVLEEKRLLPPTLHKHFHVLLAKFRTVEVFAGCDRAVDLFLPSMLSAR